MDLREPHAALTDYQCYVTLVSKLSKGRVSGEYRQLPTITISPLTSAWETDWIWIMHLAVPVDISTVPCKASATVLLFERPEKAISKAISKKTYEVFGLG